MRKYITILGVFTAAIYIIMFTGCGEDELTVLDETVTCKTCHNYFAPPVFTNIAAKQIQWEASVHATGGNFIRNNGNTCAICHTSEGFRESLVTGADQTAEPIENPTPLNCHTCHQIHTNYDNTDFALTTIAPVEIRISGETVDFGKGNLCAMCHQPKVPDNMPTVGGGDIEITDKFWGPHYGTQASILGGTGGYEIPGTVAYANSAHTTVVTDGCPTCHMATAHDDRSGGHTLKMSSESGGSDRPNIAGCVECHADIDTFDLYGVQTEIAGLLDELKILLIANNLIDDTNHAVPGSPGRISADQAGILLNYLMVLNEGSHGVHNTRYSRALLQNSIEALKR